MKIFVLWVAIYSNNGSVSVHSHEYEGRAACEAAARDVANNIGHVSSQVRVTCNQKGQ